MAPNWTKSDSRFADLAAIDPHVDLALGTAGTGFFPAEQQRPWASVMLRLRGISAAEFATGRFYSDPDWQAWWQDRVHVPAWYRQPIPGLESQEYCTAYVRHAEFFDALLGPPPLREVVARVTLGQFFDDYAPPVAAGEPDAEERETAAAPVGDPEPGTVVIGIIDDGLAFAHERFRLAPYETRVEYLWLQDGGYRPEGSPVAYGRELRKAAIDGLLRRYERAGRVDEDDLYRGAGAIDFRRRRQQSVARRAAHGTHVMDLACGYDFRQNSRHDRPIVGVQLPAATTEDTSGATLDDYGLDAVRYILDRADAIARRRGCGRLPVVINFSYGNVAGPHDGSSALEQAMDALLRARRQNAPTELVLPAGNSNLARLHAKIPLELPEQKEELRWRVLPDDRTPSFMEIWLPREARQPGDPSRVSLTVSAPGGQSSGPLGEVDGAGLQLQSPDPAVLAEARYRHIPGEPGEPGRGMFLIALQPTARTPGLDVGQPVAPAGVWTVTLEKSPAGGAVEVQAWIQRDDMPFGFRRSGRQSYFDHECYRRFDVQGRVVERDDYPAQAASCLVKRAGSTNAIATGKETTIITGRLGKEHRLASYSAREEEEAPKAGSLDDSEISDASLVHGGVLAAGTRSGSRIALRGTSVAAPQRARQIADLIGPPAIKDPQPEIPRPRRFRGQPQPE